MKIKPARRLRGKIAGLPGDKSISHRAALIAALADGRTRIGNFATSADCASTLACLAQLGIDVRRDGGDVYITGADSRSGRHALLRASAAPLDCGNSGSTMRLLAGVLAGHPFASTLTGDASLRTRPMRRIIEPLALMGARLSADEGHAPLSIEGRRPLAAISYEMPVASAQVKSAILLAGLFAGGRTEVVEKLSQTRDHTERMLRWFGVEVETRNETRDDESPRWVVSVEAPPSFAARDIDVPGDISSAAFLIAAAALLPGSEIEIDGVGINPTRAEILRTMRSLGADVNAGDVREQCNEAVGQIRVRGADGLAPVEGNASGNILRGAEVAGLIDELPVLAVVGTQVAGGLEIRDAAELRVKESDRIRSTVENLRAMGAEVEEFDDGLRVAGRQRLRGARLDSHGDHRIAMAFTVAALVAEGESEISGAEECVRISFPEFFTLLESVTER